MKRLFDNIVKHRSPDNRNNWKEMSEKNKHHRPGIGLALFVAALLLTSCAVTKQSAIPTNSEEGGKGVKQLVTPAGHQYWYYSMPGADRTAVAITWSTELPQLPDGQEATARLGINLMLNGGAGGQNAEQIIADFEDLDAGSQLWVQPQEISGFILTPEKHMNKASEIANLVLTQPNFDPKWFAREKKQLYDQAAERESIVFGLAWNLSREITLGDHPYKRFWSLLPLDGVDSITLDAVKAWHNDAFTTDGMSITVAGNADIAKVSSGIDRVLESMPDHKANSKREAPMEDFNGPVIPGKTVLLHQPDADKSAILIIGKLPSHSSDNDIPLNLSLGVLGHGKQSRLFKAVRSGLRAAYGFGAGTFDMTRQHTIMHISGEVETAKLQQALDETERTYDKFLADGIGAIEFPIAKRFYLQRIREEIKKPESVAYMMMDAKLNKYGPEHMPNLITQIERQKRPVVNAMINENFPSFDSLLKIIVSPDRDAIEDACVITDILDWQTCQ